MADQEESAARRIHKRFRDFSVDVREERVIVYIVRQLRTGRRYDDIMNDSYITTHTSSATRDRLLQHPEVLETIEDEMRRQFKDYHSAAPPPSHGTPEAD
jgi:hypothetical protein